MEEPYQRLADDLARAGGHLELAPGELASRLGRPVDVRDSYAQYVVKRHLAAAGIDVEFRADGSVALGDPSATTQADHSRAEADASRPARSESKANSSAALTPTPVTTPASTRPPPTAPANPLFAAMGEHTTRPPPTPADPTVATVPSAKQVGNGLYALLVFVCTFFPAIGHQLAPGGKVGDKQEAFFAIYFATFPLSLAATFICLMFLSRWFKDDKERFAVAGVAIVVSAAWGIGFGTSYADQSLIAEVRGNGPVRAFQIVALALGAYAVFYGWVLFIAGLLSSFFAALWIKEKADAVQKALS